MTGQGAAMCHYFVCTDQNTADATLQASLQAVDCELQTDLKFRWMQTILLQCCGRPTAADSVQVSLVRLLWPGHTGQQSWQLQAEHGHKQFVSSGCRRASTLLHLGCGLPPTIHTFRFATPERLTDWVIPSKRVCLQA